MKTLLLIRHAKSSWADRHQSDIERPLNDRGKRDAPLMAARLHNRKIQPDIWLYSPALRTTETLHFFQEVFHPAATRCILQKELYLAPLDVLNNLVCGLQNDYAVAAIIGHNPGLTEWANALTNVSIDNMPTCSIFAVQIETENWGEFQVAPKRFLFFDYPKLLH